MDSRWARVKSVFDAARSAAFEDEEHFLNESCGPDTELRREVEGLLAAHRRAGDFLEDSAARVASRWIKEDLDAQTFPERLGVWRLLTKLGHGGMSSVYLVERVDGAFEKRAALKILRLGIFGSDVRRRFQNERQILAELEHPHIVRLLDGGVSDDGRPYIVMDYVDGESLTDYVHSHLPADNEKLKLFLDLCDAVSYAHRHSIVHRDLKPSNVLVTPDGA